MKQSKSLIFNKFIPFYNFFHTVFFKWIGIKFLNSTSVQVCWFYCLNSEPQLEKKSVNQYDYNYKDISPIFLFIIKINQHAQILAQKWILR